MRMRMTRRAARRRVMQKIRTKFKQNRRELVLTRVSVAKVEGGEIESAAVVSDNESVSDWMALEGED